MKHDMADEGKRMNGMADGVETWMEHMINQDFLTVEFRRWLTTCLWWIIVLIAGSAMVGCGDMQSAGPVPAEASVSMPSGNLAPGDVINVIFSGAPELSTKQKIQPNGRVSLPTVGDVSAAGKTITGLQQQLSTLYQPHLQDSTVVVSLAGAAAGVYVSGEVLRPGKIPLDRPMTALEAVMEAGGFTKLANPKQVLILRNQEGKSRRYVLDMNETLGGSESIPFYVRAFDVVYVKQSFW